MRIISESPWSYVLFDDGRGWVLTAAGKQSGGDVSIRLSASEMDSARYDSTFVRKLVADIAAEPARFEARALHPAIWPKAGAH
jgi:hypothetical protein